MYCTNRVSALMSLNIYQCINIFPLVYIDIDECSERLDNCMSGCSNTEGSFVCTCEEGYMLDTDGRSCKCGGYFTESSGSFNTPGWPTSYPKKDFECVWMIDLPNPNATVILSIDDTAYGIHGRSPCPTDYIQFFNGMHNDDPLMYKLCKFDIPEDPIQTSSSQAKVVFTGSNAGPRMRSRVGARITYTTVGP